MSDDRRMTRTSDDYTEAVLLWPDGTRRRCCIKRVRLDTPEEARAKLARGVAAWVRVEDEGKVGTDGAEDNLLQSENRG